MLDNPTLWSIIPVAFTKASKKPNGRAIHIFLERSKATPLKIFLQLSSSLSSRKTLRHPAFQALVREAPRWRLLQLAGISENREACETLSNFQVVPMPSLYHLIIVTSRTPIDLQSNLPWTRLTMLRLHGFHNVPALVQLCPKLTQLSLILDSELGKALPLYPAVIRHNNVKFLSLWLVSDPNMPKIPEKVLDVLDFPSLDTVLVRCYERPPISRCIAALVIVDKFIQRSSCTLMEFGIHDVYIFYNFDICVVYLTILYHNPSITCLIILDPSRSSRVQDAVGLLRQPGSIANPLTNLQTLEFWTWRKDCDELQMELIGFIPLVLFNKSQDPDSWGLIAGNQKMF
ncbi:hypothetical protein BDP27DRAFT_1448098, partial [Rhodocollybia butyracea]